MSDFSENSITIESGIDEVRALLFDLGNYPQWATAIKSAEVKEKDDQGRPTKVKVSVDAGVLRDQVTLDYDWSGAPGTLTFSLDEADLLTEMTGSYISAAVDDETKVSYQLKVGLSLPVPSMMRKKAELATIDQFLSQLKAKLES
jgi:uncharacterized membrane protein